MARISLRAYNAEIEALIEDEKTDEAVAHCRHILTIFPKHIHTYRLLGKAYLESRQHTEALDIFERLLTAVPEDFISHLGMSIIREEEGNLDAAIWHMERAFEIQPYNGAIQDEMRRLYGRRDGAEPVKVRLTRGALARMYARGNLYEQAIAEIRQVLANEPQRADMQVLLAQMYERLEKPVQAAEVCSRLLKKYPYCLEANRILAGILENTERAEDAETYRERLKALDPYYAFINPQAPTLEDIPDEAVQLEKMGYEPGALVPTRQESGWLTTIGVEETALATMEEEELPEWLTEEGEFQEPAAETDSLPEASAPQEDAIPDWMKEAGWEPGSGEFDESAISLEEPLADEAEEGTAAPAEIPDWLQEIAPPEVATGTSHMPGEEDEGEEDAALAALMDTGSLGPLPEAKAAPAEEIPEWLSDLGEEAAPEAQPAEAEAEAAPAEEIPEWLSDLGEEAAPEAQPAEAEAEAVPAEEIPEWLNDLGEKTVIEAQAQPEAEAVPAEEIPEWLSDLGEEAAPEAQPAEAEAEAEAAPAEEIPEWLSDLGEEAAPEAQPAEAEAAAVPAEEIPEWLSDLGEEAAPEEQAQAVPEAQTEIVAEAPEDMDDAMAWLESLAARQGASEEELLTAPEERPEEAPEWVQEIAAAQPEAEGAPEAQPAEAEAEAAPAEEIPEWLSDLGEEAAPEEQAQAEAEAVPEAQSEIAAEAPEDMDDAMAWLENLAARQGASEEELLTAPEERPEEAPEWVQEIAAAQPEAEGAPEAPAEAEAEAVPEEPGEAEAAPAEEIPAAWVPEESLESAATGPLPPPPDWVLEGKAPQEDTPAPITWDESGQADIEKLELNQASLVQLERLPGIGFRLAQAITTYREAHGPFHKLEDLEDVAGIGPTTIAELRDFLYVEPPARKKRRRHSTGMPIPDAEAAFREDNPEEAVRILTPVIRSGGALDEVIHMLGQALRTYPANFEVWVALGDAYLRAERLDEALEAYSRAEEILAGSV